MSRSALKCLLAAHTAPGQPPARALIEVRSSLLSCAVPCDCAGLMTSPPLFAPWSHSAPMWPSAATAASGSFSTSVQAVEPQCPHVARHCKRSLDVFCPL
ncbi:hypothetical protein MHYP_G00090040 [Metynnis hypsauchen]